jgi:hypothetical protein
MAFQLFATTDRGAKVGRWTWSITYMWAGMSEIPRSFIAHAMGILSHASSLRIFRSLVQEFACAGGVVTLRPLTSLQTLIIEFDDTADSLPGLVYLGQLPQLVDLRISIRGYPTTGDSDYTAGLTPSWTSAHAWTHHSIRSMSWSVVSANPRTIPHFLAFVTRCTFSSLEDFVFSDRDSAMTTDTATTLGTFLTLHPHIRLLELRINGTMLQALTPRLRVPRLRLNVGGQQLYETSVISGLAMRVNELVLQTSAWSVPNMWGTPEKTCERVRQVLHTIADAATESDSPPLLRRIFLEAWRFEPPFRWVVPGVQPHNAAVALAGAAMLLAARGIVLVDESGMMLQVAVSMVPLKSLQA